MCFYLSLDIFTLLMCEMRHMFYCACKVQKGKEIQLSKRTDKKDEGYWEVFARTETDLNGERAPQGNRDSETNLGDLITDAMLWNVSKDVN